TIDKDGNWTYEADNNNLAIQAIKPGETRTETFTVTSSDGVTKTQVTITINGTDDVPELTDDEKTVTEDVTNGVPNQLVTSGAVSTKGGDVGEQSFVAKTESGQYGTLTVNKDGSWYYEADNSNPLIQALKPSSSPLVDEFTVMSSDGVTTTTVTINIVGVDDVPTLTGSSSAITEGVDPDGNGLLETNGKVTTTGGDEGEQGFVPGLQTGSFGNLTIDANGNWTYEADNSQEAIHNLKPGETLTDIIKVTSSDGVTQTEVIITINGTDDVPVLTKDEKTIYEDDTNGAANQLVTSGVVTATGGDFGEQSFKPGSLIGIYGKLTINEDGHWQYEADNGDPRIQALKEGDSTSETFTVLSSDGVTTTTVTIIIQGNDTLPTLTGASASVTEDATNGANQLEVSGAVSAVGGDAGDQHFVAETVTGDFGNLTVGADGSWTYLADNSQKLIQDLKPGDTLTDIITVTDIDGVSTTQVVITINGTDDVPTLKGDEKTVTEDITNGAANQLVTSGIVTATGGDAGEQAFKAEIKKGQFGTLTIDASGHWHYEADNGQSVIQNLKKDDTLTDTIKVTSSDGVTQTEVVITIVGVDDVPQLVGSTGAVTEDVNVNIDGKLESSGKVTSTGGEPGEDGVIAGTQTGNFGDFIIDKDGNWTYEADNKNPAMQALKPGETRTESFIVTSSDGVTQTQVTVTITGADDVPKLTGDAKTVIEDATNGVPNQLVASGLVKAEGGDTGEQEFLPETKTGLYGELTIDANGYWTYLADNSQKVIQDLKAGETMQDIIEVTSSDGVTKTEVVITIVGVDDVPKLGVGLVDVTEDTNVNVDGNLEASGTLTASGGDAGEQGFKPESLTGTYGKLTIDDKGNWHYLVDNSLGAVQALPQGASMAEQFIVTSSDGVTKTTVDVLIHGVNDVPPIVGKDIGEVRDDSPEGMTSSGKLDVDDVDTGESAFRPQTAVEDDYGRFTINPDGTWSYELDPTKPAFTDIAENEHVEHEITVTTIDGTTKT
ncbi:MAG: VCBS domain-containing protein, partial [Aeromonas sp.]